MYHTPHFKSADNFVIWELVRNQPFAVLTGSDKNGRPVATQLPLLLEEREDGQYLSGHLMRKSDHHLAFEQNPEVLAMFMGPHAYVSATWYTNPHMGSTWNYLTVHCRGKIQFLDQSGLIAVMKKLTLHFENGNPESATAYDNLPQEYIDRMLPGIVGFEIKVEAMEHVFKLSQNRDPESFQNIIEKLEEKGGMSREVAAEMRKLS